MASPRLKEITDATQITDSIPDLDSFEQGLLVGLNIPDVTFVDSPVLFSAVLDLFAAQRP